MWGGGQGLGRLDNWCAQSEDHVPWLGGDGGGPSCSQGNFVCQGNQCYSGHGGGGFLASNQGCQFLKAVQDSIWAYY